MTKDLTINKKVNHDYFVEETIEAGISLFGWEVKSLVAKNSTSLIGAFIKIKDGEAFLVNMNIAPLKTSNQNNLNPLEQKRTRKLLLHKKEIFKLVGQTEIKGYTLIPLKIYLNKKVKVLIGICKGKKLFDKRQTEKENEQKREQAHVMKKLKLTV